MNNHEPGRDPLRRIGLFGGTFNPIHNGHLRVAGDVLRHFELDRIYFIPSAMPPHKKGQGSLAGAEDRLTMVRLALENHPRLAPCDIEIKRPGFSYSIDTVGYFKSKVAEQGRLFFILGMDAFLEIDTWKAFAELFEHTDLIVMSRPGTGQWTPQTRRTVENYVQHKISPAYALSAAGNMLVHPSKHDIHLVSVMPMDISSSRLRAMVSEGRPIAEWVPAPVAKYISQRGLY